jgi:hypothetical protein
VGPQAPLADRIVVAGSLAQQPDYAGHTWFFLQYLLGFKRLGVDVLFLDWLSPELCDGAVAESRQAAHLVAVMDEYGLGDSFALLIRPSGETVGLSRREVIDRTRSAAFLLNVMGFLDDEEILAAASLRVFLDIDPGFPQMWRALGLADPFAGHDVYVTIGENIGKPDCRIPTCGLEWLTTHQPVVLDEWTPHPDPGSALTAIGSWRGPYGPLEYDGRTYGLRVHEFRKFAAVPQATGRPFEAALDIDPADSPDLELLAAGGWKLVDPTAVAGDPAAYRRYIQQSRAEFMVPKSMYTETRSGWFSDRSICYLASAKPVIARDTGLDGLYPLGEGLLVFATPAEAVDAVDAIYRDPGVHAAAARALAEAYFDSDKVLERLLDIVGASQ